MGDEPIQVTRVAANAASKINESRRVDGAAGLGLMEGPNGSYITPGGNRVFFNKSGNDLEIVGSALSEDVDDMVRELERIADALKTTAPTSSGGKKRRRKTQRRKNRRLTRRR
jgi:hypothetical protein